VKDIAADGSSTPQELLVYGGNLYFVALTSEYGLELWSTDGTEAGTQLFVEINPNGDSDIPFLRSHLGYLYFPARDGNADGIDGFQLWRSDGTELGTEKLSPENPDQDEDPLSNLSEEITFAAFNETIFIAAHYNNDGRELWKLDEQDVGLLSDPSDKFPIKIYPVPASNQIYINLERPTDLIIVDSSGKVARKLGNQQSGYVNITSLKAGVYTVIDASSGQTERFIKN